MGRQFDPRQRQQIVDQPRHPRRLGMHDAEKALARPRIFLGRPLQRIDETRQRGQRRAQFVAGIGDEIGAHFLDPAQRRLVVERHQHAFVGAAEQGGHRHRRDDQFHPAIDRHVVEIGRAPRFGGRDRLAQRGDDFGRAQRELGELVRRSAGASWAAAALRWITRPARSSSTAGSGIPATTALTAAASTGLTPRTSSREVTASCSRHGTRAAAAMQTKTAAARTGDNSPNATSTARARPAASRIIAECRSRSGHGAKKEVEEESSIAIGPCFPSFLTRFRLREPACHARSRRRCGHGVRRRCRHARAHRPPHAAARRRGQASIGAGA